MKMTQSRFFCTCCGKEGLPVMRKKGQQREAGHLKKLFCIYCHDYTNHAEIKETGIYTIEDFQQEFKLGRFKNGNKEPINKLVGCSNKECPFNINGRCWNSNNSEKCKHKPVKELVENE